MNSSLQWSLIHENELFVSSLIRYNKLVIRFNNLSFFQAFFSLGKKLQNFFYNLNFYIKFLTNLTSFELLTLNNIQCFEQASLPLKLSDFYSLNISNELQTCFSTRFHMSKLKSRNQRLQIKCLDNFPEFSWKALSKYLFIIIGLEKNL